MVRVKMCGFTSPEDARMAVDLGVDMIGMVVGVNVDTPREIGISTAKEILETVSRSAETVLVSMPGNPVEAEEISGEVEADFLQVHNELPVSDLREIKRVTDKRLIGVVSIPRENCNRRSIVSRAEKMAKFFDMLLLDTRTDSGGGSGETHDWSLSRRINDALDVPLLLAGGLNSENVTEAVERVNPYGVDVSSGVESDEGRKDPRLMNEFVAKVGG